MLTKNTTNIYKILILTNIFKKTLKVKEIFAQLKIILYICYYNNKLKKTNKMKLADNESLQTLIFASNRTKKQVVKTIIDKLLDKKIIIETEENYGCTINDCQDDCKFLDLVDILKALKIKEPRSSHFEALLNCVIIGNGDCPICGGEMITIDGDYNIISDNDTPTEYNPIWEQKQCVHCGHTNYN